MVIMFLYSDQVLNSAKSKRLAVDPEVDAERYERLSQLAGWYKMNKKLPMNILVEII